MASPQKENGHTQLANELLEAILGSPFTQRELKVNLCVIRYTYGFNRKSADLSVRFISKSTSIKFQHVSEVIKNLVNKNVILVSGSKTNKQGRTISFNKNYDEWLFDSSQKSDGSVIGNSSQKSDGSVPKKGTDRVPKMGTKKYNNKNNLNTYHPLQEFIKENYPRVSKIKTQLTHDQCKKLTEEYSKNQIAETLNSMENHEKLLQKYNNVNLTLRNWIKRQFSNNGHGKANLKEIIQI